MCEGCTHIISLINHDTERDSAASSHAYLGLPFALALLLFHLVELIIGGRGLGGHALASDGGGGGGQDVLLALHAV